jgi:hypothetical protein
MIVTDFDESGGTAFEAQAVLNDSGSGLFINGVSGWELAGTIVTVGTYNNQPGGVSSALFGNLTYAVDLHQHKTEIESYYLPVPEPSLFTSYLGVLALGWVLSSRAAARSKTRGFHRSL